MIIPPEIRKSSRSVKNRIQSILSDAQFVLEVEQVYQKLLVANKRCGLWYVPPEHLQETCYFKSTDGHVGQWNFSTKRLNLHLLKLLDKFHGLIIVDSTRRGKLMPDAFSKTIPIWCAVINRAVFGTQKLYLPRNLISESEFHQIYDRVDRWVDALRQVLPDPESYRVAKPLRPIWVTQDGMLPFETPDFPDFYPVILCTASECVQDGVIQRAGYSYVQGAGDDHELWAGKLTPELLWSHAELWQDISEAELIRKVELLDDTTHSDQTVTALTTYVSVATSPSGQFDIDLRTLGTGKPAIKKLGPRLPSIDAEFGQKGPKVCIVCNEIEIGIAVCLLLDCLYFDSEGKPVARSLATTSKEEVAKRLVPLTANGRAIPSRATLNIIGSYLRG